MVVNFRARGISRGAQIIIILSMYTTSFSQLFEFEIISVNPLIYLEKKN